MSQDSYFNTSLIANDIVERRNTMHVVIMTPCVFYPGMQISVAEVRSDSSDEVGVLSDGNRVRVSILVSIAISLFNASCQSKCVKI